MADSAILYLGDRSPHGATDTVDCVAALDDALPDYDVEHRDGPLDGSARSVESLACVVSALPFDGRGKRVWDVLEDRSDEVSFVYLGESSDDPVPAGVLAASATGCLFLDDTDDPAGALVDVVSEVLDARVSLEAVPEGAFVVDGNGTVTRTNERVDAMLGTDGRSLVGASVDDLVTEGVLDAELVEACSELEDPSGTVRAVEFEGRSTDGTDRTIEALIGRPKEGGSRVVTLRDVTERKRQEERLGEVRQRYRRVVDQDLYGVYIIQDGHIRYVNRTAAEMFGYSPDEMIGEMTAHDVVAEEDHDKLDANIEKRERGSYTDMQYELSGVRKDGSRLEFEVHSGLIEYEGEPALLGALIDITERKRRRQRIRVLNRVLRHNLRNDLNLVIGRMEDAIGRLRNHGDDQGAETLSKGVAEARALVSTSEKVRKIQEALEHDNGDTPAIDAADAVERVVGSVREANPSATIHVDVPEDARIDADVSFELVVENLVTNGVEHNTGDRAEVTVGLSERTGDHDGWYRLRVADDGPGIPEQEQVVVDEDAEVTPLYHSSGVGLWTVAWIVESFGGNVEIETEADGVEGTLVTVDLPRTD